jgi:hypothetical protein
MACSRFTEGNWWILDGMVKKQDKIPNDVIKRLRGMQQALATADAKAKAKRGP